MIDVRKLRALAELARLGTVAAVADVLHLSAPAVSMQLSSLERELGIALTERRGRRLELTLAGRTLAAHGKDIADRLALIEFEADGLREGTIGHYRIAAFPSAARTIITEAWTSIIAGDSALTIELVTLEPEHALANLLAGSSDLAIVHDYSNLPRPIPVGVDAVLLGSDPVRLALRADDAHAVDGVDLASFARRDWIVPTQTLSCFEMVDRACGRAGFRPKPVAETVDFAVQLGLVQAGIGVALIPDLAVETVPPGVALVRPRQAVERHVFATTRTAQRLDPGISRIIQALRHAIDTLPRPLPSRSTD
ncbi:MAG: LysR family transcriptional regulator [Ilumatobacteraceae bacterium]